MNVLHDYVPKVAAAISDVHEELYMVAIKMHKAYEGVGIVLVYRPFDDTWITWEWVSRWPKATLHTGHYDMGYEEGMMDFEARGQ